VIKVWSRATRTWSNVFFPGKQCFSLIKAYSINPTQPNVGLKVLFKTGYAKTLYPNGSRLDTVSVAAFATQDSFFIDRAGTYYRAWTMPDAGASHALLEFVPNDTLNGTTTRVTGTVAWNVY